MADNSTVRFTALAALVLSGMALGITIVTAGCEERGQADAEQAVPSLAGDAPQEASERVLAEKPTSADRRVSLTRAEALGGVDEPAGGERRADDTHGGEVLEVKRLVVTRKIHEREPTSTSSFEADGEPVIAFVELVNAGDERKIEVTFEHESGTKVGFVKLAVPSSQGRWRTWGQTQQIRQPGRWHAVVSTASGEELARAPFDVTAADES